MQHLEVSSAVLHIYKTLGGKGLIKETFLKLSVLGILETIPVNLIMNTFSDPSHLFYSSIQ
jgi:hypothetical protein